MFRCHIYFYLKDNLKWLKGREKTFLTDNDEFKEKWTVWTSEFEVKQTHIIDHNENLKVSFRPVCEDVAIEYSLYFIPEIT